jgi:lauroyl/myristoyl acyltransferase
MPRSLYYSYKNHRTINPDWRRVKTAYYTYLSVRSFLKQRYDSFLLLKFGKFKYKSNIVNKKYLDSALKKGGVVFVSIHADSYPLAGKVYGDFYKTKKIIVPFYHHNKVSVFNYFKKKFEPHGIDIVRLGGAMKEVGPILSDGGSIVLFLDAEIPVNRSVEVEMFGKIMNLSTGPYYLADKYGLTIIPFSVDRKGKSLNLRLFKPISHKGKSKEKVTQEIADVLQKMILMNLKRWHVFDRVLQN